jgi:predicted amidohydrolase
MKKIVLLIIIIAIAFGIYILYKKPGGEYLITPRLIDFIDFPEKENPSKFFLTLKVAVVSMQSGAGKEGNIKEIERIIDTTTFDNTGMRLIIFGEASLGLYDNGNQGSKYQRSIAEPLPGPFSDRLAYLAERFSIYIAAGLIEVKDGKLYNSLVVVNPKGKIEAIHRKMLLHYIDEKNGITQAEPNFQVIEIDGFKIGLSICSDANDRWLFQKYTEAKINALIYPFTSKIPWLSKWLNCWPYSKLYNCWILAANRYGIEGEEEYDGTVFISSPSGFMHYSERPENNVLVHTIGK